MLQNGKFGTILNFLLHHFSDASKYGYVQVRYFQITNKVVENTAAFCLENEGLHQWNKFQYQGLN